MNPSDASPARKSVTGGVVSGISAYLIWGLSPLYWKFLASVGPIEIILHRILWSFVFLLPLVLVRRRWREFTRLFASGRTIGILLLTGVLVAFNWFLYIWSVNSDRILEASLGYFMTPLVNVLLAVVFLKEPLRIGQKLAILLAASAVAFLILWYGVWPWIPLALAFSFGFYGLIRKVIAVGSIVGLCAETLFLSVAALAGLIWLEWHGQAAFLQSGRLIDVMLAGSALVTALPLLLFTFGARRLRLSTIGFMQYIAPSCMFILGTFVYGEPLARAQWISFAFIWSALALYSIDTIMARHPKRT